MRLLLTRPEPDASRTAAELRSMGCAVVLSPVLRIELLATDFLGDGQWDAVLMTSANAARAIAAHPQRSQILAVPVLAVGRGTAQAAREAGFADVVSADGDGVDLARLAAARYRGGRLLYLAGTDRARDLQHEMPGGEPELRTVAVYRAAMADALTAEALAAFESGRIDGVLHYSRRSAEAFIECARPCSESALAVIHFCLSDRTAEPIRAAGASRVRIAERPDEAAMLAMIRAAAGMN